jgi:parallel beta-helix repeat protein
MKYLSIPISIILFLSLVPVPGFARVIHEGECAFITSPEIKGKYVSDDGNKGISLFMAGPVMNQNTLAMFATIQAAIDDPGTLNTHTIIVSAGNYMEEVNVTKELTFEGANAGIAAGLNPGVRGPESNVNGGFIVNAPNVVINGFRIYNGRTYGGFKVGVALQADDATISNSIIDLVIDLGSDGITTTTNVNNLTLSNCTIEDNWRGIYLNPGSGHTLTGNLIDNNHGVGVGIGSDGQSNLTLTGNQISNHTLEGWGASAVGANVLANDNLLINNGLSIAHYDDSQIDATCNWWGSSSFMDIVNEKSGNVLQVPFRTTSDLMDPCNGVGPVQNLDIPKSYATILEAIADPLTVDGHTISVSVGSYTENIVINKNLTIIGPNVGTAGTGIRMIEAVLADCNIDITAAGPVILDGFHILQTDDNADVILISGGTSAIIQNNILERNGTVGGQSVRAITTSAGPGVKTIQDNWFTGDVSGGLFGSHKTWNSAIYVNGASSFVDILNNTFENSRTALNLDDYQAGINVTGNTFDNCGTFLSFGGFLPTNGQFSLGTNDFKTPASAFVNLSNVDPAFRLDITTSTLNGAAFNTYPLTTLFLVESGMYHRGRSGRSGLVYYVADNQYVVSGETTIQSAVDYAATGDVINVATGTYNEHVIVDRTVTIDGGTMDCTDVVIDGEGLRPIGVEVLVNVLNVILQDFSVQNTNGGPDDAGVRVRSGCNGLNISNLCISNTSGRGGIYVDGDVNGVTIDNCEISGSGVDGRGIVVWNGFKQNITITNNHVHDIAGCCGIELQDGSASGVSMTGNTVEKTGDSGMSAVGLNGTTGSNTISNNTINNTGRFGLEIKNPDGDGSDIIVANNIVSITGSFAALKPGENRDIAGIAVFRRALTGTNVDVPTGVQVTNNTITGYIQDNGGSSSEGFGIVIEGLNHTVTGNTVNNNDVGIQQQAGHSPYPGDGDQSDLTDDYFGRGNSPITCGNVINSNTFSGNGTNTRDVGVGAGIVANMDNGKSFCSIQAAIDDAGTTAGHTIVVSAGTYQEHIVVNKSLTLTGTGSGSDPGMNTVLTAPVSCTGTGITISADNVTVSDMFVTDFWDALVLNGVVNPVIQDMALIDYCHYGMEITGSSNANIQILETEIQRTSPLAGTVGIRFGTAVAVNGLLIDQCAITGNSLQGMVVFQAESPVAFDDITIQNSTISNNLQKGLYFEKLGNALLSNLTMDNNGTDPGYGFNNGIDINLKYDDYSNITIEHCDVTNSGVAGTASDPENAAAITIKARDDAPSYNTIPASLSGVQIINNHISGAENGIRIGEFGKVNASTTNVTIEGNDLSHAFSNKSVINRTSVDIQLNCNWHGTTDLGMILSSLADAGSGGFKLNDILDSGIDGDMAVGFQPSGSCTCPNGNLVTNMTNNETFCFIQAAIDDPGTVNGDILQVSAGQYIENVVVHKSVIIQGPNAGISPNTGSRVTEAIVYPAESQSDAIFLIEADDVQIDGLTLDGDNTSLVTGWPGTNGADLDVYDGIAAYDPNNILSVGGLQVKNNIIRNVAYFGVDNFGWYNYNNHPTSGHLVDDNLFQDLGTYGSGVIDFWGGGVLIYNDNYTRITNNVMTNVRIGIQTGNFHDANPGDPMYQVIDNNTIQARRRGIFYNLHTGGPVSPLTVSNNMITGLSHGSETVWDGMLLSSLSNAVGQVIDNSIDGTGMTVPSEGFEVWNVNPNAPVLIQGGSASNVDVGIFVNNFEGYNSDAGNTSCVIDGVDLTVNLEKGIYIKDSPGNTNNATVHALVKGNTEVTTNASTGQGILVEGADASAVIEDNQATITGNSVGILVDQGNAIITGNTIAANEVGIQFQNTGTGQANNNNISGNTSYGVVNTTGTPINATLNWWGDASGPSGEGMGSGDMVSTDVDYCPWLDASTPGGTAISMIQNISQSTYHCSIQEAINAAAPTDEIQVADGQYSEHIIIDRPLTLKSVNGKALAIIAGSGSSPTITVTSGGVTIDGFTITNPNGTNAIYSNNNSDLTVKNSLVTNVGSSSFVGKPVHAVLIEASASTIDNIQINDNMIMAIDGGEGGSVSAITVGFSTGNFDVTNLVIDGNMISDIDASVLPFASFPNGGRGAYGVLINLGSGSGTGEVVEPVITNNSISDLEGLWAHGIGLEGNTPGADVSANTINDLTDHKMPSDAVAVMLEQNSGVATVRIQNNNFENVSIGVQNVTGTVVDARLNWWGDLSGPGPIASGSGVMVSADVLFCPWLTAAYTAGPPVANNAGVMNTNTGELFCSIQDAIDHPSTMAGHVIEILAADHTEPGQIVVDKSLTIQGQGKANTILRPGVNTGTSGNDRGFILVNSAIECNITDLTIDGTGKLIWQAIRHQGSGVVDNVGFTQIKYNESTNYQGTAIAAFGTGNLDVTNCMFSEIGRIGVLYYGTGITGSNFSMNTYTGKGPGNWLDYALDISAGAIVHVEENTISNNKGVAMSDGSTSAGILVTTFFGGGTEANITNNDISGNSTGIHVGYDGSDTSTVIANYNNLEGNDQGVTSTAPQVDATLNWWGDASGPSGEGPGMGDAVSTNVDFCGWLIAPYDGSPNPATAGIPDPDPMTTIQACSGEQYSFDLDDFFNNNPGDLGQVTYVYDVTVVPDVDVLVPDPREMGAASSDGLITETIDNFGSQALTVRYTVTPTSQYGCVGPVFTVDVVINLNPQVDIIPNGSVGMCAGTVRVISGTVVPPGSFTYLWEILDDPSDSDASTILPTDSQSPTLTAASDVTTSGTLKVKFTATNNVTGCKGEEIFDFYVYAVPVADDPADVSACDSYTLPALGVGNYFTGSGGTGTMLMAGDMITSTQTIYVYAESGTMPNCTDENSFMVTIHDSPMITGDLEVCVGNTLQLSGSGNPAAMDPWMSSDENIATVDADGLVTGVSTGMVMITYTDENGCTATVEVDVNESCPCEDFINLTAMFLAGMHEDMFHAGIKLTSDGVITNGEDISFKAGQEVELMPEFEVELGAILTVDIMDCIMARTGSPDLKTRLERKH